MPAQPTFSSIVPVDSRRYTVQACFWPSLRTWEIRLSRCHKRGLVRNTLWKTAEGYLRFNTPNLGITHKTTGQDETQAIETMRWFANIECPVVPSALRRKNRHLGLECSTNVGTSFDVPRDDLHMQRAEGHSLSCSQSCPLTDQDQSLGMDYQMSSTTSRIMINCHKLLQALSIRNAPCRKIYFMTLDLDVILQTPHTYLHILAIACMQEQETQHAIHEIIACFNKERMACWTQQQHVLRGQWVCEIHSTACFLTNWNVTPSLIDQCIEVDHNKSLHQHWVHTSEARTITNVPVHLMTLQLKWQNLSEIISSCVKSINKISKLSSTLWNKGGNTPELVWAILLVVAVHLKIKTQLDRQVLATCTYEQLDTMQDTDAKEIFDFDLPACHVQGSSHCPAAQESLTQPSSDLLPRHEWTVGTPVEPTSKVHSCASKHVVWY